MAQRKRDTVASTGIAGLDEVLRGGLPTSNLYILQGPPGSGKTTAALQFLRAGIEAGEKCIYVSLSQSTAELEAIPFPARDLKARDLEWGHGASLCYLSPRPLAKLGRGTARRH